MHQSRSANEPTVLLCTGRGTGSARAALVTGTGNILAEHAEPIETWFDPKDSSIHEQSSSQSAHVIPLRLQDKPKPIVLVSLLQSGMPLRPVAKRYVGWPTSMKSRSRAWVSMASVSG